MTNLFKHLNFKYSWRSYQEKLLAEFDFHIRDNHFHVIAPPGSGKTLLGLEIAKRLGKKTLVLAPTLTIRNQWEDRLQQFFTKDNSYANVSFDIKKPNDITFSTYQSLQALHKHYDDIEQFIAFIKKEKIAVLVLDEAHHLKNTWWNSLYLLKQELNLTIVALTATPPYDSTAVELSKYFKLCGEIDAEIAVPDLVKEGDLAPHQDFVFFSTPKESDIYFIADFRRKVTDFTEQLKEDKQFIAFVKNHRFYAQTAVYLEEIYSKPTYFSALLIFLNAIGITIPFQKLKTLGFSRNEKIEFPTLNYHWFEILLQHILIDDRENLSQEEKYLSTLSRKLKALHLLSANKVNLLGNDTFYKSLSQNPSKLDSILSIVKAEQDALGDKLRLVVLSDYIRNEFLHTSKENLPLVNQLGVLPIFQYLRFNIEQINTIAVLTGSVVIIHKTILAQLEDLEQKKLKLEQLNNSDYILVPKSDTIVNSITQLFEKGTINILIGTKALLGEGWDAPSINTLILASFVGSFVTSNQMRGRAIRANNQITNKTGNIWHLACLDPTTASGGKDMETLERRFNVFMGISNTSTSIENGIERLALPKLIKANDITKINSSSIDNAQKRTDIITQWHKAIASGYQLTKQLRIFYSDRKEHKRQRKVALKDSIRFFVIELSLGATLFNLKYILHNLDLVPTKGVVYFVYSLLATFFVNFGHKTYLATKAYIQYGFMHKKIKKIGKAILNTMADLGYLTTDLANITILSHTTANSNVTCTITGVSQYESTLFINALEEVVKPIDNPRYLIIIKNYFRRKLDIQNFYAVPTIFGTKKKDSALFLRHWKKELGHSKLFYTRHAEGRKLLLKARMYHMSNAFKKITKNSVIWK